MRVAHLNSKDREALEGPTTPQTQEALTTPPTWEGLAAQGEEGPVPVGPLNSRGPDLGPGAVRILPTLAVRATRPTKDPARAARVAAAPGVRKARRPAPRPDTAEAPPHRLLDRTDSLGVVPGAVLVRVASRSSSLPLVQAVAREVVLDQVALEASLNSSLPSVQVQVAVLGVARDLDPAQEASLSSSRHLDQAQAVVQAVVQAAQEVVGGLFPPRTQTDLPGQAGAPCLPPTLTVRQGRAGAE